MRSPFALQQIRVSTYTMWISFSFSFSTEGPFTDSQSTIYFPIGTVELRWYKYYFASSFAEKFCAVNSKDPLVVLGNSAFPQYKAKL